jgi:hypothetical protein
MSTNLSMNGNRPVGELEKKEGVAKDTAGEKDEKIKDLTEKNERLEKDFLKMQIQIKTLEDKLKIKTEKDYVVKILFLIF